MTPGIEMALPDAVAHHATRVLRLPASAKVTLFSGDGGEYSATLMRIDKRGAAVRIVSFDPVERESPLAPTLVLAVIAADAMDFAVRKAVELGVAAIVPVVAARSQGAGAEKAEKRLAHWRQIAIAACEQCGRNRIPPIAVALPLHEWLAARDRAGAKAAMLVPGASHSLAALASDPMLREVLVGPEGGFTDDEVDHALAAGVLPAHLGPRVLRAETAALAALATLDALRGDGV